MAGAEARAGARRVFLADFGLAKSCTTGSRYTRTGEALGTPSYMSPEQARGEVTALTPASDVWALGCLAYALLTGRPPFGEDEPAAVVGRVLSRPPPAFSGGATGPPRHVRNLVLATLAKLPARRPPAAGALRDECARVLRGEAPRWRGGGRPGLWPVALAAAAAATLLGAWIGWRVHRARPGPSSTVDTTPAQAAAERAWAGRFADPAAAVRACREALDAAPDRHDWRLRLAILEWATGDAAAADATLARIPAAAPEATRASWLRGLVAQSQAVVERQDAQFHAARDAWQRAAAGRGAEATWARAGLALQGERFDEARALLESADHWEPALLLGLCETTAWTQGRPWSAARAEGAFSRALADGIPLAWAFNNRARIRTEGGDLAGAKSDLDAALRLRPQDRVARLNRAWVCVAEGDADGARADMDAVVAMDPADLELRCERAHLRRRLGDLAGAEAELDGVLARSPTHRNALSVRADVRTALGRVADALADYDALLQQHADDADALVNRGVLRLADGQAAGAIEDFSAALALAPDLTEPLANRAEARRRLGDAAGAIADATALLARVPNDAAAHYTRALAHLDLGDATAARLDLDAALLRDPDHVDARVARGGARAQAGDLPGALADLDAALSANPGAVHARVNRSNVHAMLGNLAAARADLDAAIAAAPDTIDAWHNRGILRWEQGDRGGAIADLEAALARTPPDAPDHAARQALLASWRAATGVR